MARCPFDEDGSALGASVIDASGIATFAIPGLTPGIHAFVATYPGQSAFTPAVSVRIFVLTDHYNPTVTFTSSPNPSDLNQPVTFTAVITPTASPIVLRDTTTSTTLATLNPNSAGVATFITSSLALGNHVISATYPGDTYHNSTSATLNQSVVPPLTPTTTTLTATPVPAQAFQFFTVTVSIGSPATISAQSCSPACTVT